MFEEPLLDLAELSIPPGMPALSVWQGGVFQRAASVCLEECKHVQFIEMPVNGHEEPCSFQLTWPPATAQDRRTHNALDDAARDGAYGIALLVALKLTGQSAIEQSRKGTGFDYWIGPALGDIPFAKSSRLEVSGILRGNDSRIKSRVKVKKNQTRRSDSTGLPAYACVIEFSKPEAHFEKR